MTNLRAFLCGIVVGVAISMLAWNYKAIIQKFEPTPKPDTHIANGCPDTDPRGVCFI